MRYNRLSRRAFLQGSAGATFAVPFLPSLMGENAFAQTLATPPRLISLHVNSGSTPSMWFPTTVASDFTTVASEYKAARLSALATKYGKISPILVDPRLAKYANLINIFRGVDGPYLDGHTKAGSFSGDWANNRLPINATIDYLVSRSPKIYPTTPVHRLLNFGVSGSSVFWNDATASYSDTNGVIAPIPPLLQVTAAFDYVFKDFVAPAGVDPTAAYAKLQSRRKSVLDLVFADYKNVLQSPRLAASEKQKLNIHVEKFRELERKVAAVRVQACTPPTRPTDALFLSRADHLAAGIYFNPRDISTATDIMIDIIVTAFACGLNNVATLVLEQSNHYLSHLTGVMADNHRASHGKDWDDERGAAWKEQIRVVQGFYMSKVARLVEKLDVEDGATGKKLIDNTLIVGTNEMGMWNHRNWSLPCFTISGLPQVNSGWYIDYRSQNVIPYQYVSDQTLTGVEYFGRDYNSFLMGVMLAMGLQPSDWEKGGLPGFGSYHYYKTWYSETDRTHGIITPGRRSAMPFMLKT
jgi:hypothetical protein